MAGTGRRGGFFADENNPFFLSPPGAGHERPGFRDNASDNQIDDLGFRVLRLLVP
jgi:hypothetical protein